MGFGDRLSGFKICMTFYLHDLGSSCELHVSFSQLCEGGNSSTYLIGLSDDQINRYMLVSRHSAWHVVILIKH